MSASSPPTEHPLTQALQALDHLPPLVVALSGGADSSAMLVACAQRWPGQVRAVHIHHGLQAAADTFAQYGEALCARCATELEAVTSMGGHRDLEIEPVRERIDDDVCHACRGRGRAGIDHQEPAHAPHHNQCSQPFRLVPCLVRLSPSP